MAKTIDNNGFWDIKNNPISKVGVFPYLGRNISPELEPNKIYYVYRPADELFDEETIKSFNDTPVPLVDEHEMIGKGFTPAEEKGIEGVVSNVRRDGDKLIGDISIYSEKMKQRIESGKKDLSMGYFCSYELADGDYNGEHYDAIQRNIRANHVAVVDNGRCGSDVCVYDSFSVDADFVESDLPRKKDEDVSDTVIENEIKEDTVRDGGCVASKDDAVNQSDIKEKLMIDKDKIAVLKELVAMLESGIEQSADEIEIKEDEEQKVKDGDLVIKHDDDDDNSENEIKEEEKENVNLDEVVEKKINEVMDSVDFFNAIEKKQELISKVRPLIGDFNYSKMNNKQIAKYACDKLDLEATEKTAEDVLNCYLKIKPVSKVFASDEVSEVSTSIIDKYLKGE